MEIFEDEWIDEDVECASCEDVVERITSLNNAKLILKEIQINNSVHFKRDIKKIARFYIKHFFINQKDFKGNKIKKEHLFDKHYIFGLLNYNISSAVKLIYSNLSCQESYLLKNKFVDVTNDVKLVNEALKKIYKAKVPQQFAGGILLMYLQICKGINIISYEK